LSLLWVPVAFLPVANFIVPIGVLLAERTLYLPSVVCAIALAAAASHAVQRPEWRQRFYAACAIVLVAFAVRTVVRIPDWDSTDSILLAQLRDRPNSFRANWHVARIERRKNVPQLALQHYARAVELWPYRERLIVEAAAYAGSQSQKQMALRLATHGTQQWPKNHQLQRLLAANALDLGDTTTARAAIARGLTIAPQDNLLRRMDTELRKKLNERND
jgi:predicted Zn-dependent protease